MADEKSHKPPRFGEVILRIFLNDDDYYQLAGDLEEAFAFKAETAGLPRARMWYWSQVVKSIPLFVSTSLLWSFRMFGNYGKIALRNLKKQKGYSFINISGLAAGFAAFLLVYLFIAFELSYDSFHENADRLYRVRNDRIYAEIHDKSAACPPAVGPVFKEEFPEVIESARMYNVSSNNNVVTYYDSPDAVRNIVFSLEGYEDASDVSVVGNFNYWHAGQDWMQRKDGRWECTVKLAPGTYSYRFRIDDTYIHDTANPEYHESNGRIYSDLTVEQPESAGNIVSLNQDKVFYAEASFLRMFSFPFAAGASETALEEPYTAVLSASAARKYFGDDDPMGKAIKVTNNLGVQVYTITGVCEDVPANSHIKFELLLSYATLVRAEGDAAYTWGWNAFNTYLLLAQTADAKSLEAKFPDIADKYNAHAKDFRRQFLLQPIRDIHLHSHLRWEPEVNGDAETVYFLGLVAVLILVVAWVNYINLSTARSLMRAKEVGVRKVLGSRRTQLIRQFLCESAFFNILALILALIIVEITLPYFNRITEKPLSLSLLKGAWFPMALSLIAGSALSGMYPAFILSSFNPVAVLKGAFNRSAKGVRMRKYLVAVQFAISIVLIAVTITVYRQINYMRTQNLRFDIERTVVVTVPQIQGDFGTRAERFRNELLKYPAVRAVTLSATIPGKEYSNTASGIRPLNSNPEDGKRCFFIDVDHDYFDFYGIELLAGRTFSDDYGTDGGAILMNEAAARLFGYTNPEQAVQQKILLGGLGDQIRETIGVIRDYHHKSLRYGVDPIIFSLSSRGNYFSIRIDGHDIDGTCRMIGDTWNDVLPGKPFEYFFLDSFFDSQYKADRQFGKVFGLFAALAILVSCLGLISLVSYAAETRTKEIGIRKTLGASVPGIVLLLTKDFLQWIILANIIAWPAAYAVTNAWLQNFAHRTDIGWITFLFTGVLTLGIALFTVSYQAVSAARARPAESLRYE